MGVETIALYAGAVTGIAACVGLLAKVFVTCRKVIEGIRCQLRTDMLRTYYRNADTKTIRQYELQNFESNYEAYRALKGNSFIADIHDEVVKWKVIT